jgi:Uma2 family endonuclease
VADLERLPDDGNRYEILHGELLVTSLPSAGHQGVAARLFVNLAIWCRANTGWRYLSPGGVYISETTWLEPDIAARTIERWTSASEFPETFSESMVWTPDATKPAFEVTGMELFGPFTPYKGAGT